MRAIRPHRPLYEPLNAGSGDLEQSRIADLVRRHESAHHFKILFNFLGY